MLLIPAGLLQSGMDAKKQKTVALQDATVFVWMGGIPVSWPVDWIMTGFSAFPPQVGVHIVIIAPDICRLKNIVLRTAIRQGQ